MKEEKKKKQSWEVEIPIEEIPKLPECYNEYSKLLYRVNEDLIGHLMVWDDIDKLPDNEWVNFWKSVKSEKIRIRKLIPVKYRKKHVNMFTLENARNRFMFQYVNGEYVVFDGIEHSPRTTKDLLEVGGRNPKCNETVNRAVRMAVEDIMKREK